MQTYCNSRPKQSNSKVAMLFESRVALERIYERARELKSSDINVSAGVLVSEKVCIRERVGVPMGDEAVQHLRSILQELITNFDTLGLVIVSLDAKEKEHETSFLLKVGEEKLGFIAVRVDSQPSLTNVRVVGYESYIEGFESTMSYLKNPSKS